MIKPSSNEKEYFARQEAERLRKAEEDREAKQQAEQRERERALHFMKCPKCGMDLEEITFEGIHLDKCAGCEGIWLDKGELESVRTNEAGFMKGVMNLFRS